MTTLSGEAHRRLTRAFAAERGAATRAGFDAPVTSRPRSGTGGRGLRPLPLLEEVQTRHYEGESRHPARVTLTVSRDRQEVVPEDDCRASSATPLRMNSWHRRRISSQSGANAIVPHQTPSRGTRPRRSGHRADSAPTASALPRTRDWPTMSSPFISRIPVDEARGMACRPGGSGRRWAGPPPA